VERLIDAAFEAFAEQGFEKSRVQDIARRAGFTTGAIYGRFDGKAALLAAVISRNGRQLLDIAMAALADSDQALSVIQSLAVESQAGPATQMHSLLADACAVAVRDDDVRDALLPLFGHIREVMASALVHARDAGSVDPGVDPAALVHLATTLLLGSFLAKAIGLEQPSFESASALMDRVVGSVTAADQG
jgi:AcrR family transcriptional regulator